MRRTTAGAYRVALRTDECRPRARDRGRKARDVGQLEGERPARSEVRAGENAAAPGRKRGCESYGKPFAAQPSRASSRRCPIKLRPATSAVLRRAGDARRHLGPPSRDGRSQKKRPGNRAGENRRVFQEVERSSKCLVEAAERAAAVSRNGPNGSWRAREDKLRTLWSACSFAGTSFSKSLRRGQAQPGATVG
jgi:hypothetical protein